MFSHDLMEVALGRLFSVALAYQQSATVDLERAALFSDAWTIVDQVHVVRQVLSILTNADTRKDDTAIYLSDFSVAPILRNKMDHLNQNLPNRARATGRTSALFGMLSFFRPYADRWEKGINAGEIRGDLFLLSAGSTPADMVGNLAFNDLDIHLPVCSFKLEAFDHTLLLERAVLQLRSLLRRMSDDLKFDLEAKVPELSRSSGVPVDELLQPAHGNIMMRLEMGFNIERQSS